MDDSIVINRNGLTEQDLRDVGLGEDLDLDPDNFLSIGVKGDENQSGEPESAYSLKAGEGDETDTEQLQASSKPSESDKEPKSSESSESDRDSSSSTFKSSDDISEDGDDENEI